MSDNTVLKLSQPSTFSDPLTEVLRSGARSLLARAVEAEVAAFLDGHSEARTEEGRRRLVRHGHLPEREIMTGIGPVAVRAPRVRDRTGLGADRIRFSSALLPPYARRSKSLEVLIPVLYLKAVARAACAAAGQPHPRRRRNRDHPPSARTTRHSASASNEPVALIRWPFDSAISIRPSDAAGVSGDGSGTTSTGRKDGASSAADW